MSDVVRFARLLAQELEHSRDMGDREPIVSSLHRAISILERAEAVEAPAPWDGRPPEQHLKAPAHVVRRKCGGEWISVIAEFRTSDRWMETGRDGDFLPAQVVRLGWEYVSPLYPREAEAPKPAGQEKVVKRLRDLADEFAKAPNEFETAWRLALTYAANVVENSR